MTLCSDTAIKNFPNLIWCH